MDLDDRYYRNLQEALRKALDALGRELDKYQAEAGGEDQPASPVPWYRRLLRKVFGKKLVG